MNRDMGVWDGLLEKDNIIWITRKDRIQNTKILNRLQYHKHLPSLVRAKKLKYFGHVKRMDNNRNSKILLDRHIEGNRPRGRPKKKVAWRHQTPLWKRRHSIGGSCWTPSKKRGPLATESSLEAISGTNLRRKALSPRKSKSFQLHIY